MPTLAQANYTGFLLREPRNYTKTRLAAHLAEVGYDWMNRFLRSVSFSISQLRALPFLLLTDTRNFLLVDDSV